MSELIIPPTTSDSPVQYLDYGVQISNPADSVTLRQTIIGGTIEVIITSGNAFVAPIDLNNSAVFNISDGEGSSTLKGAAGSDLIFASGGDDFASGGNGDDFIDGGEGNNLLQGEEGNDFLLSGSGNDTLEGSDGIDLLISGTGNDSLDGGAGNDILIGGPGNDTLVGGDDDDRLQGGPGKDSLIGGEGVDRFRFEKGAVKLKGGKGGKSLKNVDVIEDFNPDEEVIEVDRRIFKGQIKAAKGRANEFGAKSLRNEEDFAAVEKLSDGFGSAKIIYEKDSGLVYFNTKKGLSALVQLEANLDISASNFEIFY